MPVSSELRSAISNACGYMDSDIRIANHFRVTEKEVASIRRSRPSPRKMMQHEPIADASVDADTAFAQECQERCEAHLARLWRYYERGAEKLGVPLRVYALMAMETGVSKEGLARARMATGV